MSSELASGQGSKELPSIGAVLLFGRNRERLFPSATIRCARFLGKDTTKFLDQTEIDDHLPKTVDSVVAFIERHTRQGIEIGRVRRREVPEYPVEAVREAVINAIVHADGRRFAASQPRDRAGIPRTGAYRTMGFRPGPHQRNVQERRSCLFQDPISRLNPEMLYRQIQYLVEEDDWAQQGEEVEAPSKTEERGT